MDARLAKELESHPKRPIHTVMPGQGGPNLEPVVIAGVAFYLDHENQMVIPIEPVVLPPVRLWSEFSFHVMFISRLTNAIQDHLLGRTWTNVLIMIIAGCTSFCNHDIGL